MYPSDRVRCVPGRALQCRSCPTADAWSSAFLSSGVRAVDVHFGILVVRVELQSARLRRVIVVPVIGADAAGHGLLRDVLAKYLLTRRGGNRSRLFGSNKQFECLVGRRGCEAGTQVVIHLELPLFDGLAIPGLHPDDVHGRWWRQVLGPGKVLDVEFDECVSVAVVSDVCFCSSSRNRCRWREMYVLGAGG